MGTFTDHNSIDAIRNMTVNLSMNNPDNFQFSQIIATNLAAAIGMPFHGNFTIAEINAVRDAVAYKNFPDIRIFYVKDQVGIGKFITEDDYKARDQWAKPINPFVFNHEFYKAATANTSAETNAQVTQMFQVDVKAALKKLQDTLDAMTTTTAANPTQIQANLATLITGQSTIMSSLISTHQMLSNLDNKISALSGVGGGVGISAATRGDLNSDVSIHLMNVLRQFGFTYGFMDDPRSQMRAARALYFTPENIQVGAPIAHNEQVTMQSEEEELAETWLDGTFKKAILLDNYHKAHNVLLAGLDDFFRTIRLVPTKREELEEMQKYVELNARAFQIALFKLFAHGQKELADGQWFKFSLNTLSDLARIIDEEGWLYDIDVVFSIIKINRWYEAKESRYIKDSEDRLRELIVKKRDEKTRATIASWGKTTEIVPIIVQTNADLYMTKEEPKVEDVVGNITLSEEEIISVIESQSQLGEPSTSRDVEEPVISKDEQDLPEDEWQWEADEEVEVQGAFDYLTGGKSQDVGNIIADLTDMMPTLKGAVFDSRVIIDKIKDMLPMIEGIVQKGDFVSGSLQGFVSACSDFHSAVNSGKDVVKTKLISLMSSVSLKGLEPLLMLLVVGVAYFIGKKANTTIGIMCAVMTAAIPLMRCDITQNFMSYVFKNFESIFRTPNEGEQEVELQGISEGDFAITPHTVVHLLLVAASLLIGGALPAKGTISTLIDSLGKNGRNISGISSGMTALEKLSSTVGDAICKMLYNADPTSRKHIATISLALKFDIAEFMEDVHKYALDENRFVGFSTVQRADKVRKMHARSLELLKYIAETPVHAGLGLQINNAYKITKQLLDDLHQFKGLGTARVDPFHISFYGDSGIGKSTLIPQFCNDVLDFRGEPRIEGDDKYFRQPASKYWDGYYGQIMVIYDDLAAVVHNDTPSDVTEMIQIKSNTACQVVMADIKEKGLHFTSKYIVSTTNIPMLSADAGLRHPEAFHRRRNLMVKVRKVRPFNTGNPEFQNAGHLTFELLNPLTLAPISEQLDYGAFFAKVNSEMDQHFMFQEQILKSYDNGTYGKSVKEVLNMNPLVTAVEVQGLTKGQLFLMEKAYYDGSGTLCFLSKMAEDAFNNLDVVDQEQFVVATKNFFKSAIEKRDIEALLALMPKDNHLRVAYAQCLDEITIVEKPDGVELLWDDEDAQEEYSTWDERDKYLFRCIVQMRNKEKQLLCEHSVSKKAVSSILANINKSWDGLSDNAKTAFRLAVGAGSFLAVVGTLYSAKQLFAGRKLAEKNIIDNTVLEKKVDIHIPIEDIVTEGRVDRHAVKTALQQKLKVHYVEEEESQIQMEDESQFPSDRSYARGRKNLVINGAKYTRTNVRAGTKGNPIKNPYRAEGADIQREDDSQFPSERSYSKQRKNVVIAGKKFQNISTRGGAKGNPIKQPFQMESEILMRQAVYAKMSEEQRKQDAIDRKERMEQAEPITVVVQGEQYQVKSDIQVQANNDGDAQNLIFNKFVRNLGIIFRVKDNAITKMQCLFVTDTCVIAPWHFFYLLSDNDCFNIILGTRNVEVAFDSSKLVRIFERDLCVYRCGSRIEKVRPIVKFLASMDDHHKFVPTGGILINSEFKSDINVLRMRVIDNLQQKTECMEAVNYVIDGETHVLRGYSYRADTVQGECGSPIIQENKCTNGKIVGIHVCANVTTKVAYAEMIVREQIQSALQLLDTKHNGLVSFFDDQEVVDAGIFEREVETSNLCDIPVGDIGVIGSVSERLAIYVPQKSNIRPTVLHGVVCQARTEPAILSPIDERLGDKKFDPVVSGINKYGGVTRPFCVRDRKRFVSHMIDLLKPLQGTRGIRGTLSLEQAINGVPGVDFMDRMNMSSSEGFPYVKARPDGFSNKSWMFKQAGQYYTQAPKLEIQYEPLKRKYLERLIAARKGERIFSVSAECTKDERVSLKKIYDEPKTRVFTIMPCDFTMAVRAHFLDFCSMIMSNRAILPMKVGLNPIGAEWTELYEYLREYGDLGFAGDFKAFDGLIDGEILSDIGEIVNGWYDGSKEDSNVRQVLLSEHSHRYSLASNTLLEIYKGIPSGSAITVHVNNLVNLEYLSLAWLGIMRHKDPAKANMTSFFKFVRCAVFGDDNNIVPSPSVREYYNLKSVHYFLADRGITYTDDKKRPIEESEPLVPVLNMTFLKRSYVPHSEWPMWKLAPLEKQSIEERVMWVRGERDIDGILYSNIEESLFDAHMHGREYYEDLKYRINWALHARGMRVVSYLYEDMEIRWLMTIPVLKGIWEHFPTITARNAVVVQSGVEEIIETHGDVAFSLERGTEVATMEKIVPNQQIIERNNWNLEAIAQRPVLFDTYNLDASSTTGHLRSWNFPQDLLWNIDPVTSKTSPRSAISRILEQHAFYKTDIVVRMHINTTPFYGGHLMLCWDPLMKHSVAARHSIASLPGYFMMHKVYADISTGEDVEIRIPFNHVVSYLGKKRDYYGCTFMGKLHLVLMNRLMYPSGGSSNVDVSLYGYLENLDLSSLKAPSDQEIIVQGEQTQLKITSAGEYSRAGVDNAIYRFCLTNSQLSPLLKESSQSMSVKDLVQREGMIEEGTWSENTPRFNVLQEFNVSPIWVNDQVTTFSSPPYMTQLSQLFCYWRGSIHFKLTMGATQFHTGRFVIVFHPGTYLTPGTTISATSFVQYPHLVCDLKQGHEFNFTVPFTSPTAWKPTFHQRALRNRELFCTGHIQIFVLDRLRSPSGSLDFMSYFLTVRGGSDFEFAVPRNVSNTNAFRRHRMVNPANPASPNFVFYDDVLVQAEPESQNFILGMGNPMNHINTFKEDYMCIKTLISRYADCGLTFSSAATASNNRSADFDMGFIPVTPRPWMAPSNNTCNPLAFFSQFFTFWRGSLKYKFQVMSDTRDKTQFARICHVPNRSLPENPQFFDTYWKHNGFGEDSGLAGQTIQLLKENIFEFEVPYYSMYDSLFIRTHNMNRNHGYPLNSSHNGCLKLQWRENTSLEIRVYIAAGDDFEFLVPNGIEPLDHSKYAFGTPTLDGRVPGDASDAWTDKTTTNKPNFVREEVGTSNNPMA